MTQTPEESAMAIASSISEFTALLRRLNPKLTKPEAMKATALLVSWMVGWIESVEGLQEEISQMLEEIVNERN